MGPITVAQGLSEEGGSGVETCGKLQGLQYRENRRGTDLLRLDHIRNGTRSPERIIRDGASIAIHRQRVLGEQWAGATPGFRQAAFLEGKRSGKIKHGCKTKRTQRTV